MPTAIPGPPPLATASLSGLVSTAAQTLGAGTKSMDRIRSLLGSSSDVAIGPNGDDNTGFQFPAADTINTYIGGTLAAQITATRTTFLGDGFNVTAPGLATMTGALVQTGALHVTGAYTAGGMTAGAHAWLGSYNGSTAAGLWLGNAGATPSTTNYTVLAYSGAGILLNAPVNFGAVFQHGGTTYANIVLSGADVQVNTPTASTSMAVASAIGGSSGDRCVKAGTTLADGSVNSGAKIFSVGTGIGGTYTEKLYFTGRGTYGLGTITDQSGSPGNCTIDAAKGRAAIANAATTCTVTNDQVTADSVVIVIPEDSFGQHFQVVPTAGSFTITTDAAVGADKKFRFVVIK